MFARHSDEKNHYLSLFELERKPITKMSNTDKVAKAKSLCAQAYTHVSVQGEYAQRQYDELLKDFGQDNNLVQFTCQMTGTFLKKLRDNLSNFIEEIETVSTGLQSDLLSNIKKDESPEKPEILSNVEDAKPSEIYRVETPTQSPPGERQTDRSKRRLSDALLEQFEALEKIGNDSSDDSMTIGSLSLDSSRSCSPMNVEETLTEEKLPEDETLREEKLPENDIARSESSCASDYTFSSQDYRDIFNIKECHVVIDETSEITNKISEMLKKIASDKELAEIERLTNWQTLEMTKRQSQDDLLRPIKVTSVAKDKKTQREAEKEQEKSDESEVSDDDSPDNSQFPPADFELRDRSALNELDNKLDDETLAANAALAALTDHTTEDEYSSEDTTDVERNLRPSKKKKLTKRKHRRSEDEEKDEDAAWKDDPLLRGRLPSSSDEDKPKGKKQKLPPDDVDSQATTEEEIENQKVLKQREKVVSSSESDTSRIFVPDSNSDDSSDLEIISYTKGEKHHRKNIRAVNDEALTEETRRAVQEEEARIQRLKPKIEQMSQKLSQHETEELGLVLDADKTGKPLVAVNSKLTKKLKDHQKLGVQFMWNNCYESLERMKNSPGTGCILAHCMGLGKTLQVITLVHTLFKYPETKTSYVVVVCPLSTVLNWENEFRMAFRLAADPSVQFKVHLIKDKMTRAERYQSVRRWKMQKGVLVIGYDGFVSLVKDQKDLSNDHDMKFAQSALLDPGPDLVICDEGHLIKNDTKQRAKVLTKIKTKRRIVLTGTPLQNNLKEYYQMVQFVKPNLLGTPKEFSNRFENPIKNGSYHDSQPEDIKLMRKRSHILHEYLKGTVQRFEVSELESYLPEKIDFVLFITLHPLQIVLYKNFLEKCTEASSKRMLADYMALRNVWTHPYMLQLKEKEKPKVKKPKDRDLLLPEPIVPDPTDLPKDWYKQFCPEDIDANIHFGPKVMVAFQIIEECEKQNEKLLIFSRSLLNLDTIEHFLKTRGTEHCKQWRPKVDYLRMDGNVSPDMRMEYIAQFADRPKLRVFLISQEVGGMGINLVAANRIILMDVNFNPAVDSQSIFRIYRFGQTKKCYIYRLVSMGTMEEVNYERSVTKSAISARVIDEKQISRHYKSDDLHRMYRFNAVPEEPRPVCKLPQDELLATVMSKRKNEIFKYHEHQALLENRPEEQLNEEEQRIAWDEFKREQEMANLQQVAGNRQFVANNTTVFVGTMATAFETMQSIAATTSAAFQAPNGVPPSSTAAVTSNDANISEWVFAATEQLKKIIKENPIASKASASNNKDNHHTKINEKASTPSSDALIVLNDDEVIATMPHKENLQPTMSVDLTQLDTGRSVLIPRNKSGIQDSKSDGYQLNKMSSVVNVQNNSSKKVIPQVNMKHAFKRHIFNNDNLNTTSINNGAANGNVIEIDLTES